jgi:hypothetical protein
MSADSTVFLNDAWHVYFHDPFDPNWKTSSYVLLSSISTIEECWHNLFQMQKQIQKGIFFVMREYVFPCWDDPNNINGGCLSIKILKEHVPEFWEDLVLKLLGETILKDEHTHNWNKINGISCSPKKHFCIVKIWLSDDAVANKDFYDILSTYYGDILFKLNLENIHNE